MSNSPANAASGSMTATSLFGRPYVWTDGRLVRAEGPALGVSERMVVAATCPACRYGLPEHMR